MDEDQVAAELQKLKPHHLLVTVDGEEAPKRVAIPNVRNRWTRIEKLLAGLQWRRIEACDKAGGILQVFAAVDDATTPADPTTELPGGDGTITLRERDLVVLLGAHAEKVSRLVLDGQREVRQQFEAQQVALFNGVRSVLDTISTSTRAVTAQWQQAITLAQSSSVSGDAAPEGINALMPLLQTVGALTNRPGPKKGDVG